MDNKLKRNILKSSAATSIGTLSSMAFQFITVMLMARYVSKEDFGIYVLVIVIVGMFNLLGGLGLELTMVKFIAVDDYIKRKNVLVTVLILRAAGLLIFSILFIFLNGLILHYFDERLVNYVWYIILIFNLSNFRDLFYNLMQGLNQFKQYSIVNVTSSAFRVTILILFIYLDKLDIESLLVIEILSTLQPLIHQLLVIPFRKLIFFQTNKESFRQVIKFSIPLYINNLVAFFSGRINIFIIGFFLNPSSVANYDVASKVPMALKKIFSSFIIVYFPNLSKLFSQNDKKTAVMLFERAVGIFSITISFLVLFSFLFRNELTIILFSERYAEVSLALVLLLLNFLIKGFGDLIGYTLVSAGYPTVSPKVNSIASAISISLSLILVPVYGYMGAVYALLIMTSISTLLFYWYLLKYKINVKIKLFLKPTVIFIAAPLSLLYTGEFFLLFNIILFVFSLLIGWFISEDVKDVIKFLMHRVIHFKKKLGN